MRTVKGKIVPNENTIFVLSTNKSPAEVTLRSAEWAVITQIDGKKSVSQIAEILALSNSDALKLLEGLYKKELVDVYGEHSVEEVYVSPDFFNVLNKELTGIIGPVAPFIIDDVFLDMDQDKNQFSVKRIPELVEMISEEISDEAKKVKFQQIMLNQMKGMNLS